MIFTGDLIATRKAMTPERLEELADLMDIDGAWNSLEGDLPLFDGACELLREVFRQRTYIAGLQSALVKYEPWRKGTP